MRGIHQYARLLAVPLVLASFLSDFLSPSAPNAQDLNQFYSPPARIHFVDVQGRFHWRPFVYRLELVDPLDATYQEAKDQAFPWSFSAMDIDTNSWASSLYPDTCLALATQAHFTHGAQTLWDGMYWHGLWPERETP